MSDLHELRPTSALDLLNSLFEQDLIDNALYDPDVVTLVREHLGQMSLHSNAGTRLAESLLSLAKARTQEAKQ